jgi:hypothetical protein
VNNFGKLLSKQKVMVMVDGDEKDDEQKFVKR